TFTRDYVASCPDGYKPLWGLFEYHLTTPGNSHIEVDAQTAAAATDLNAASLVFVSDSTTDNFGGSTEAVDVGSALRADTVSPFLNYLRLQVTLFPTSDGSYAPILHDWDQRYSCVPAE